MPARLRKLVGLALLLALLAAYVGVMSVLADYVPRHWAAQLAYFVVAGFGWALPAAPLITWMSRGR